MTQTETVLFPNFRALAQSRKSWLGYTGDPVDRHIIEELVTVAGSAPSETNLQPWRFIAALGPAVERLVPAFIPPNQPKLRDAGNVVLVYSDPTTIRTNEKADHFYALGYTTPRDFAVRNASLAAMVFMLAAQAYGLATRPMVGFDPEALHALVDVSDEWVPVMSILIGHPSDPSMEPTTRNPVADILTFL